MTIYYESKDLLIKHGDCIELMRELPDNCVDSVVTDPPYGLGFMGRQWDALPPGREWAEECLRILKPGGHLLAFGGTRTWHRLAVAIEDAGFEIRDSIAWIHPQGMPKEGSLKPAFEPICLGRKPFTGTRKLNIEIFGTGALNGEAGRIGESGGRTSHTRSAGAKRDRWVGNTSTGEVTLPGGRWPANVAFDEGTAELLGEPAKYFFVAKAPKKERPVVDGVSHPTVKPLTLMRWLVKLVTPAGGIVLDPFLGSGTTAQAALAEGFRCIGMEVVDEYLPLIATRLSLDFEEGQEFAA